MPNPASSMVSLLLVEDDEVDIKGFKRALKELRISNPFLVAHNGLQALDMLRGTNGSARLDGPYIIILDLNMPRMDGIEFLRELRADKNLRQSVVFVLTTSSDERDRERAYEYNVAGFISKSEPADSLREAIKLIDLYWAIVQLPAA